MWNEVLEKHNNEVQYAYEYFCLLLEKHMATRVRTISLVGHYWPIMDYKESAIETRRESLIKKIKHLICSVSGSRAIPIKGNIQYELSSRNRCFTAAKSDRYSA